MVIAVDPAIQAHEYFAAEICWEVVPTRACLENILSILEANNNLCIFTFYYTMLTRANGPLGVKLLEAYRKNFSTFLHLETSTQHKVYFEGVTRPSKYVSRCQ